MSSSIIKERLLEVVENQMAHPETARMLLNLRDRMNKGIYDREYIELAVSRGYRATRYSLVDAYTFGNLIFKLWSGRIMLCRVGFKGFVVGPCRDRMVEGNNELLSLLCHPFKGRFDGGLGDDDGHIEWTRTIKLTRMIDHCDGRIDVEQVRVKSTCIPLEVGDLHNGAWFWHMGMRSGMARWPYKCERVTVIRRHESDYDEEEGED
jgi:hypothetical protein